MEPILSTQIRESKRRTLTALAQIGAGPRFSSEPEIPNPKHQTPSSRLGRSANFPRTLGVFKSGSRRRKEADFGAGNISASLPRLRLLRRFLRRHTERTSASRFGACTLELLWCF